MATQANPAAARTETFDITVTYLDEAGDESEVTFCVTIPADAPFTDASDIAMERFEASYPNAEMIDC